MSPSDIAVELGHNAIKVSVYGIPHLRLDRSKFLGFQSFKWDKNYSIEFHMTGGVVIAEYDNEMMWKTILTELDRIL